MYKIRSTKVIIGLKVKKRSRSKIRSTEVIIGLQVKNEVRVNSGQNHYKFTCSRLTRSKIMSGSKIRSRSEIR